MRFPLGYRFAATYAGIRKDSREDLGLIVSDQPASAAACRLAVIALQETAPKTPQALRLSSCPPTLARTNSRSWSISALVKTSAGPSV